MLGFCACNQSVKVALVEPVLDNPVLLKFAFGKCFRNGSCDLSFVLQDFRIVELQEGIQLGGSICHGHGDTPTGLPGGVVQVHRYDFVQLLHLIKG